MGRVHSRLRDTLQAPARRPDGAKRSKFWLGGLILYLAMPIDLVPDFVPIAGQLDDAIIVALVLRHVLRRAGKDPIRQHWAGPQSSLETLMKFVKPSHRAPAE